MAGTKLKRKTESEKTTLPVRKLEDVIHELDSLKEKKKLIEKREKELKEDLGKILEAEGTKDNKGSFSLVVGDKIAQKQARKTVSINQERAEHFFKKIGIWEEVIEVKEVINEDYVEQALNNEKFTIEELEDITDVKTVYAIVVSNYKPETEQEVMPEIITN